jgi:hypothetical protein
VYACSLTDEIPLSKTTLNFRRLRPSAASDHAQLRLAAQSPSLPEAFSRARYHHAWRGYISSICYAGVVSTGGFIFMLGLGLWWWIANSDLVENRPPVSPSAMATSHIESSKTSPGVSSRSDPRKLWIPESCGVYIEQPRICTLIWTLFKFRGRPRDQSPDMIRKTEPDTVDDVRN